ncbi:HlyD family efflux transporter periplasmic adaptor subunit [Mesorhizobium sp.]|uniref:HlyD family efflux transporter periplasmic adaptor subunit n=1 Tax=Mesorhizobium sp. TaxID=1871066 RepID=UPI000FE71415|nr:HlyD family efflux transporter periplasmic adaptor subunit [Mesorhizobium sp.]RWC33508.1 MAG: HlyD family efflux transporter periplasmic adaptor subunit [Mesorhizobium sp.]TIX24578.1 MAG: HlyD family efflux transporter periplasmic adaptor subunit [Mesorhizobium sp.]
MADSILEGDTHRMLDDAGIVSYSVLDQALWTRFRTAGTSDEFIGAWLGLLCRQIADASAAALVLGEADTGPYVLAAAWPNSQSPVGGLLAAAEMATGKRQGISVSGPADNTQIIASPILIDGHLFGACAVAVKRNDAAFTDIMRKIQWACGWVEVHLRRGMSDQSEQAAQRSRFAFDMLAAVIEKKRYKGACTALVTELAMRLNCDPVAVGVMRRRWTRVAAVSHSAAFDGKVSFMRDIAAAMDEAIDQRAVVVAPPRQGQEYRVSIAHEALTRQYKNGAALTVPLQSNGTVTGALTFLRPADASFDQETIYLCDAVAAVVGPVLEEKRRNDRTIFTKAIEAGWIQIKRLLGPRFIGRKIATLAAVAIAAYLSVATSPYAVTAPAVIRGSVQRTIVAPFSGYVLAEFAKAGETVRKDQVLAQLDDQDLNFERLRLVTTKAQKETEFDRALARGERAESQIIEAQIKQADAQLSLIDEQLRRTRLVAPFDGFIVSGDLSQSVGAAVERGQELFHIAPLDSYRVVLEVDESDIEDIKIGQTGQLRVSALPREPLPYKIEQITSVSRQGNGRNSFMVEASLAGSLERLRPGMEGVSKTHVDERLLFFVYTQKMIDWLRLTLWRWAG